MPTAVALAVFGVDQVQVRIAVAAGAEQLVAARGQSGDRHAEIADLGRIGRRRVDLPQRSGGAGRQPQLAVAGERHAEIEHVEISLPGVAEAGTAAELADHRRRAGRSDRPSSNLEQRVGYGIQMLAVRTVGQSFDIGERGSAPTAGRADRPALRVDKVERVKRVECFAIGYRLERWRQRW